MSDIARECTRDFINEAAVGGIRCPFIFAHKSMGLTGILSITITDNSWDSD